jgi:hypothetical protein
MEEPKAALSKGEAWRQIRSVSNGFHASRFDARLFQQEVDGCTVLALRDFKHKRDRTGSLGQEHLALAEEAFGGESPFATRRDQFV